MPRRSQSVRGRFALRTDRGARIVDEDDHLHCIHLVSLAKREFNLS
jgi:hypothetical protein